MGSVSRRLPRRRAAASRLRKSSRVGRGRRYSCLSCSMDCTGPESGPIGKFAGGASGRRDTTEDAARRTDCPPPPPEAEEERIVLHRRHIGRRHRPGRRRTLPARRAAVRAPGLPLAAQRHRRSNHDRERRSRRCGRIRRDPRRHRRYRRRCPPQVRDDDRDGAREVHIARTRHVRAVRWPRQHVRRGSRRDAGRGGWVADARCRATAASRSGARRRWSGERIGDGRETRHERSDRPLVIGAVIVPSICVTGAVTA